MLTTGHIFAGGGGDTQGAIAAGYQPIWAIEYDKYAAAVYRHNHPQCRLIQEDVQKLPDSFILGLPTPSIVIGGSPCPDFSMAGSRAGIKGNRGQLFFEFIRFLRLLEPPLFIFENVKGILSSGNGEDFKQILQAFTSVGYVGAWQVRNSKQYVPQSRERIFCVGIHRNYQAKVCELPSFI